MKSAQAQPYRRSGAEFVVAWPGEGPLDVPDPAPIVSPVVPLFIAPLLTPAPGLERLAPFEPLPVGLTVAGDTAESPDGVVEPVPAFCASASELVKITANTAVIDANLMSNSLVGAGPTFACPRHGYKSEQASGGKVPGSGKKCQSIIPEMRELRFRLAETVMLLDQLRQGRPGARGIVAGHKVEIASAPG
jgi:hypothetical protein